MKPLRPFEPYKIDQLFNAASTYGPHEGCDYNVKGTSGNQDLGTPFLAVLDGEVVHTSTSTLNYGKLLVLRVQTPQGERFVRYCHCSEILVSSGLVKRGDVIAKMGSTGNSTAAHLHFDILKRKPTSWRFYTKAVNDWFDDPEVFFKTDIIDDSMAAWLTSLLKDDLGIDVSKSEGEIRAKVGDVKTILQNYESLNKRVKTLEEDYIVASKELEGTKTALELEQENRARVEKEVFGLKTQIANKDIEIRKLEEQIAELQANQGVKPKVSFFAMLVKWLLRRGA